MPFDSMMCEQHGWLSHAAMHEAGHAMMAVLLGFDFVEVTIHPPQRTLHALRSGKAEVGGVHMPTDNPKDWFAGRDEDALAYALAGSLAERQEWDDIVKGGWERDFELWRIGTGHTEGMTPEAFRPLMKSAQERTERLLRENRAALLRIYKRLVASVVVDGSNTHAGFDEALTVDAAQVRMLVEGRDGLEEATPRCERCLVPLELHPTAEAWVCPSCGTATLG